MSSDHFSPMLFYKMIKKLSGKEHRGGSWTATGRLAGACIMVPGSWLPASVGLDSGAGGRLPFVFDTRCEMPAIS
jgi:hypothetical protein